MIDPVDVLLKLTVNGKLPDVGLPLNCATGALKATVALASSENALSAPAASYAVATK